MALRLSRRDELLADLHRERQIGRTTSVQMPELTAADPELDAAEPGADRRDREAPSIGV